VKVIVVEDQRVVRAKLSAMIERMGHQVLEAEDGEQGFALWNRERPDLVLMDAIMPVLDGYAAARRIRAMEPDGWTPIIFLSAAEADQDLEKGIDAGGDDYLVKPVSFVVLHAKIRAMQRIDDMRRRMREMTARLGEANEELARLNNLDGLTGLSNRRCFDEALRREARDSKFADAPLSLVMIDVDHFKSFNDTRGHQAGDECLRSVAALLAADREPGTEVAARYGGEEFAIILPGHDQEAARSRAEKLRAGVEGLRLPHGGSGTAPWVTVSVGVATLRPGEDDGTSLLAAADWALYQAKRSGRNQVVAAQQQG
jgi:diguanylate cyclase (GGDEF)-like protein